MAFITPKITDLVVAMQKNYTCSICLEILTHPIVTKCNHQFCKDCSQHLLKQPPPVSCPLCKTRLTKRSFSENPFGGDVARAVQQVVAAIKIDAPHVKISPPKGPCKPNEFDDPASQSSEVIFIPETAVIGKSQLSRKRGRNKESDIIQQSKRPNLQNPITVHTDKNKEPLPSVTVNIVPITNTNIRSGFPSTRSKKNEMVYDKPHLRSSKPVDVGIGKSVKIEPAITDCQIVAETCPFIVEVEKEVVSKKEVTVKTDRDNVEDMEDDILVSISQVSPQEFQPSRAMTSRMLSMVTGQTQSPRTKVASWLQKSVDEKDSHQDEAISAVQTPKANDVKLTKKPNVQRNLSDPYEFVSSQRGTPHCIAKTTRKRKQQQRRNYAARTKKPFHRSDTAMQSLSTKYINNARNLRNRNQSCSSHFYNPPRRFKLSPPLKHKPKLHHESSDNVHEVPSLDSPTQDAFDTLVVEHNKTVSEHVDVPKIEEEEEEYDEYALFVTPRCPPPRKELKTLCPPHNQKSKTPAKKATLTRCRARKISELQDIVAELDEATRFTLNISGKQDESKANVTPAVKKAEEKAEHEIVPKVEQDRKLRDRNTKPTVLPKGPFLKRKKGSSDERRGGFGFFTAEDEIVDITVSQSDDEIPSKGKASARKESISPKKKGSASSEVEWRRISQLNRDFYSKRRKSSGDENAHNTHNANGDKRDIKSPEEAAGKSGLAQNPSQRSTKSCNLIGLDKDDNLIEVSNPDNNLPDIDLQNIATTSADNVVITDAKRRTSCESIEAPCKTPPGKARSVDADKHDLPVITDKRLEAKDEAQNTESAKPFKCPFTIRGKLEVTPLDASQYLCSKCQSHVIPEEVAVPEDKVQEEVPQTKLKVSDSETDDDEDQAVLLTRSSISYESPKHDEDQNVLSSSRPTIPSSAELPSETQSKQIKPNIVTNQAELPDISQTPMPRNTPAEISQNKATPCSQIRSQSSVKAKHYDKLEVKRSSQKSTATQDLHFDTWDSWLADNGERPKKPQDSFEDHNDKENQQNVAIFMKDEGQVPQTPLQNNTKLQRCVPKAVAATQRSTPPRAALSAQSPKSNHVAEKEKCQRVPERKYCRIKPPVDSDTDSTEERDEAQKSCRLEAKSLEDKEWSHYLKMKYCNKSDSQSRKVTHDPPSEVMSAKKPVESATPPIVIDLETEDDCSQSGESLFGSQTDMVTTRSQSMRNTITNIRKDLEMAGLSYPTQQASQISQGVGEEKQLQQSSESNPRGEDKKDKDEEQEDWALSAGVNVTTDRNPTARQGASASSRGAGDDGSSIFLFGKEEEDDLGDDRLSGTVPSQAEQYNTQAQLQLQDQVESLQQQIKRLEAQLKAKK